MDILCNVINMELWSSEGNLQTMLLNKNLENQTNTTKTTTTKSKSHNFPNSPITRFKRYVWKFTNVAFWWYFCSIYLIMRYLFQSERMAKVTGSLSVQPSLFDMFFEEFLSQVEHFTFYFLRSFTFRVLWGVSLTGLTFHLVLLISNILFFFKIFFLFVRTEPTLSCFRSFTRFFFATLLFFIPPAYFLSF